ncbi:hypothetical protein PVAND_004777 [Polypedilum vanderplanki]|uniref:Uncharacterized protein n=1 Tax=Polypedilum vanderplanki TaxID=319348 RepID=A0A9J6BYS4_POLVA|nr:hypothetical protein PVAND_004777 [Polypedilum vanderplanki]
MYAAAGGASCRNARRRQAQQALKDKQAAQRAAKEKLAQSKANLVATPTKSKQFHQLPANYLRTPYGNMRKMSAGYTTSQGGSKLLLPINEQSAQHHSPSHQQLSSTHKQQHHQTHTPMHNREMRLDVGHKTLTKSATASFPLVSQASTPPGTPTAGIHLCPFHHPQQFKESQANLLSVQVPNEGGIIITPATPLPSPSPSDKRDQPVMISMNDLRESKAPPLVDDLPEFPLERACSVYRNRRLDAENPDDETQQQFYIMPNGHQTTEKDYCDAENRACICTCDRVEVNEKIKDSLYCVIHNN